MQAPDVPPREPEPAIPWEALRYFNSHEEIVKTRNNLPHWQQEGACYFITFRLGDSLPEEILAPWRELRAAWLDLHPRPWDEATQMEYHKRFSHEIDKGLDEGHGSCLLRVPDNATIVADAFRHFDRDRYLLHPWVVMPNHVHLLVSLAAHCTLEKQISSWKRIAARAIHSRNGGSGTFWQKDYFDRLIRDHEHFMKVARYIERNPKGLRPDCFLLYVAPWVGAK
jgi:REP element-mobilizing transposase RayT